MMFQRLKSKKIGLVSTVSFAIGAMIGGGVFALSGVAVGQTGPSAIVSFLIAGAIVALSALSFAVIASDESKKESGYAHVGRVLGSPIWSFLTSWCFYLAGIIGAAFVLSAFGSYMQTFVTSYTPALSWALLGAAILTIINLGSASEIGKIETILVAGKLLILTLLIIFGISHLHLADLQPFAPQGTPQIFTTSAFLFIAFVGFNVITSISGHIDNPRKTVPRAMLISMLIVITVYAGVVVTLLTAHITNYTESSVGLAAQYLMGPIGGGLVIFGALIATLSSANANILGSSEIIVQLAARKEVPTILGHLRNGHPYVSVLAGAVLYFGLIISGRTELIISLANVMALIGLIVVNVAAAKSLTDKNHNSMRLPFGWLIPILGAIGAIWQLFFIVPLTLMYSGLLIGLGFAIYAGRNRFHIPQLHRPIVQAVNASETPLARTLKQ